MAYFLVHGRKYDVPEKLTLGEARTLKRIAGCSLPQFEHLLAQNDPDAMVAWLFVVIRRSDPKVELPDIEALEATEIEYHDDPPAPEVDETGLPTQSSGGGDAIAREEPGASATTPEISGPLLSDTSSG